MNSVYGFKHVDFSSQISIKQKRHVIKFESSLTVFKQLNFVKVKKLVGETATLMHTRQLSIDRLALGLDIRTAGNLRYFVSSPTSGAPDTQ